jgi:SAM-dependent methyltransferase
VKNTIKKIFPRKLKSSIQEVYIHSLDLFDSISGKHKQLTPPRRLYLHGSGVGDFHKTGEEFLNYFLKLCRLDDSSYVLDVGCGVGRMAVPLTRYLTKQARYEGFDIVPTWIQWCKENITGQFPNFQFQVADIYNKRYNPSGMQEASSFVFPYKDSSFDFVFLTSVFTHMFPSDVERYVSEISRVMKRGGKCMITFFLLNDESIQSVLQKRSVFDFSYDMGIYRIIDPKIPESAVAYKETFVRNIFEKYSLTIEHPVYYGSWSKRKNYLSFQDIIVASK